MFDWMKKNPVRWCGLEPVAETLAWTGFSEREIQAAVQEEPGIHGGDWPGFDVVLHRCRERALVARYDRRFAGQPPEEWEAIEASVPASERAAKERAMPVKKAEIEIGKEYAAASPCRSWHAQPRAARVVVLAVWIHGRGNASGRKKSERAGYVLVEDRSNYKRGAVDDGEYGNSVEDSLWSTTEITENLNERAGGYWGKLLFEANRGYGAKLLKSEFPERIHAVPLGWVLGPWAEFEKEAREIFAGRKASKEQAKEREEARDKLADRLRVRGFAHVYARRERIEISVREAEALADLLEREDLTVDAEYLELRAQGED